MQSVIWYSLFIQAWGILNISPLLHSVCPSKRTGIPLENLLAQILESYTMHGSLQSIKQLPSSYRFIIPSSGTKASNSVLYAVFRNQEIDYDYLLMQAALNYTNAYFNHESAWYFTVSEQIIERPKSSKSEGISMIYDHNRQKQLSGLKYVLLSLTDGCLTVPLSFRIAVSRHQNLNQKFNSALSNSFGEQIRKDALFSQEELVIKLIQQARSKIYNQFHKPIDGVIADHSLNLDSQLVLNFSRHNRLPMMFPVHISKQRFAIRDSQYFPQQEIFTLNHCTKHLKQRYHKQLEQAYFTASALVQRMSGSKQKYQLLFTIQPNFIHSYFDSLYENNESCFERLEIANPKHTMLHDSACIQSLSQSQEHESLLEGDELQPTRTFIDSSLINSQHSFASFVQTLKPLVQTLEPSCLEHTTLASNIEQTRNINAQLGLLDSQWGDDWLEKWHKALSKYLVEASSEELGKDSGEKLDKKSGEDWNACSLSLRESFIHLELETKKQAYASIPNWRELYLPISSRVLKHNTDLTPDVKNTCKVSDHYVGKTTDVKDTCKISEHRIDNDPDATPNIQGPISCLAKSESGEICNICQADSLVDHANCNQVVFAQTNVSYDINNRNSSTEDTTTILAIKNQISLAKDNGTYQYNSCTCQNDKYAHQIGSCSYQSLNTTATTPSLCKSKSYLCPTPRLMILCHNFQKESPENLVHLFHLYQGTAKLSNFLKEQFVKDSCYFANVFDAAFATFSLANLMYIISSSINQQKNTTLEAPQEE